jgi:hypothetical protein
LAANPPDPTPAGWRVSEEPADPALAGLTDSELIDRLRLERDRGDGAELPTELYGFLPVKTRDNPFPYSPPRAKPPILTEIVRRGARIIPALLDHLSDSRPTLLLLDSKRLGLNGGTGKFTDVYDYRFGPEGPRPAGVNSDERLRPRGVWPYRVAVGDLCFVALGRIVNRRLYVAGPDFGNGMVYEGMFELDINSPIRCPALAAAARTDWGGVTDEGLARALRGDALAENRPGLGSGPAARFEPPVDRTGGLVRLLYYDPGAGKALAETLLSEPLEHGFPRGPGSPGGFHSNTVTQTRLLWALKPFGWDGLDAAVYRLYQSATNDERRSVAEIPPGRRLPSFDLPLACARRLLHRGHDGEFRAFFTEQVARMRKEYPVVREQMTDAIMKAPSPFEGPSGTPMATLTGQWRENQIRSVEPMLLAPIEAREAFLRSLEPPESASSP